MRIASAVGVVAERPSADAPLIAVNTVANCACVRSGDRVPALRCASDLRPVRSKIRTLKAPYFACARSWRGEAVTGSCLRPSRRWLPTFCSPSGPLRPLNARHSACAPLPNAGGKGRPGRLHPRFGLHMEL